MLGFGLTPGGSDATERRPESDRARSELAAEVADQNERYSRPLLGASDRLRMTAHKRVAITRTITMKPTC